MVNEVQNRREITTNLGLWYDLNHRELPWRETNNPYFIWLSEIILQQTRVEQGLPYYEKFVSAFPTVHDLANASEDDVLKLWQGLGYYSRARNLHFTAKHISKNLNGEFPDTYEHLQTLKGVGSYTAGAIASIAFNEAIPAIDGNVIRVITRLFAIRDDVNSKECQKLIQGLAGQLVDEQKPGRHNQAMMELGATVCTPRSPNCHQCPLKEHCLSFKSNLTDSIPFKSKKIKRRSRYFHYLISKDNSDHYLLERREQKDIWQGLYQFPLVETTEDKELEEKEIKDLLNADLIGINRVNSAKKHILSHQDIYTRFYHLDIREVNTSNFQRVEEGKISEYALPRLIDRYLEEHDIRTGKTEHID